MARSPDELRGAVDSMFRIRAVESPPDERGIRRVWHRGARGAELVTDIDESGRVLSQELTLFEDLLTWEKGAGFRTGSVAAGEVSAAKVKPAASVVPDAAPSNERIARAQGALRAYSGNDRFLQHLRDQLERSLKGPADDLDEPITRSGEAVRKEFRAAAKPPPAAPSTPGWVTPVAIALGLGLVAVAVLLMMGK